MSKNIRVNTSSKGGLCCSASIDCHIGCSNRCVSCYGTKASRMGSSFFRDDPVVKEYDDKVFRQDCKKYIRKGIRFIRLGKFSDSGHNHRSGNLNKILKTTAEEGIRLIFVTKSLKYDKEISNLLISGNHILHYSLGMITKAPCNVERFCEGLKYRRDKVNIKFRITDDITTNIKSIWNDINLTSDETIITPLRFNSKVDLEEYKCNFNNYSFIDGYYRPLFKHPSWSKFKNFCGEILNTVYCCNCLCGE